MHAGRNPPDEPPCETCRVDLENDNHEAAMIYGIVKRQVVTLFNGEHDEIIDLNHCAVWEAIDHYKVKDGLRCFEMIMKTFYHFLNERRQRQGD